MKNIAIYGAGGLGREIACLLRLINEKERQWNLIGFFDDGKEIGFETEYGKVLGGIKELNTWNTPIAVVLAIGSPKIVQSIVSRITNQFVEYPNIVSPDIICLDESNLSLGKGNIICMRCFISCNVHIGDFNLFNTMITVGHDVQIGNYNSFMPAVRVSGEVKIGNTNFFGVSSVVLQHITIGNGTTIGANSLIIRKTQDDRTYIGSPASIIKY